MPFQSRIALLVLFVTTSVACMAADAALYGRISTVNLMAVALYAAIAWFLGGHIDKMRLYSQKDPLTEAYNRRYVLKHVPACMKKANKYGQPLSVLLVDVDDFKPINDKYGHKQGDTVLQTVAQTLMKHVPSGGVVARWGGDEFLVIVPGVDNPAALLARIEKEIEKATQTLGIAVTISAGAAVYPAHATQLDELVKAADKHMYERKYAKKREQPNPYIVNR